MRRALDAATMRAPTTLEVAVLALLFVPLSFVRLLFAAHGTAEEVSAKWLSRIQQSSADMAAGVDRVSVAPGVAAANKKAKWISRLQDPAVQDKWERGVRSVTLGAWQQAMKDFGINRVAQGAAAKQAKYTAALQPLLTYIDQVRTAVRNMPDLTLEDRIARSTAMQRGMSQYKRPGA